MQSHAQVVIIGAGIVGCSAAYHLSRRGVRDIVVIEQGPLFEAGGSTSHAPGLVFQTNTSKTMNALARYSVELYGSLELQGQPCFHPTGSLEVAHTRERMEDLKRRIGYATSWGLTGELLTPEEAVHKLPLLDVRQILGAYFVPSDGIAKAVRAAEAMASAACAEGASFHGDTEVTGVETQGGRVRAVVTTRGRILTERVLICAGIWGPRIGRLAGVSIPLTPVQHQYVRTQPLPALAGETREIVHPILRYQDRAMYFRQHADSYGIGSYQHEPLLVSPDRIRKHGESTVMPSVMPFTEEHFEKPWRDATELLPALRDVGWASKFNGMFSFTPDGMPVMGESSEVRGVWIAEAVWVTHGGGVGKEIANWMVDGQPSVDLRECDLHRFEPHARSLPYVRARGAQQYREVYDILHPLQPLEQPRPLRVSPFHRRQQELGAVFLEGRGWERPQWFAANEPLLASLEGKAPLPSRTGWAARFWSPIAAAEHLITRERVALFDMTSLTRIEVEGPGALALLQRLTTQNLDRPPGSVTYTAMLDQKGGIKSDITVTRLGEDLFQVGINSLTDLAFLRMHLPADRSVHARDITPGTCCIGVWGPRARDLAQSLSEDDFSGGAFPYFSARRVFIGEVPVMAQRVSYVGELGYELYTTADYGLRLWDLLWEAGQPLGVIAAGRAALESLRLEKGYRLWGVDMHTEYDPYEAGLGFTVKLNKGDFIGREALARKKEQGLSQKLCCLVLDDASVVLMGKEPIYDGARPVSPVGYVTSATYGYSAQKSFAYGYLPSAYAAPGSRVEIAYFGARHGATVTEEPLFDPKGLRLRG